MMNFLNNCVSRLTPDHIFYLGAMAMFATMLVALAIIRYTQKLLVKLIRGYPSSPTPPAKLRYTDCNFITKQVNEAEAEEEEDEEDEEEEDDDEEVDEEEELPSGRVRMVAISDRMRQKMEIAAEDRRVNDMIDRWHNGEGEGQTLYEFLGVSKEDYAAWVERRGRLMSDVRSTDQTAPAAPIQTASNPIPAESH
jgi:hypothetical protein